MLQINIIREKPDFVRERLCIKNAKYALLIDKILETDQQKRQLQNISDNKLAELNNLSKEIGIFFRQGNKTEAENLKEKTLVIKEEIKKLESELKEAEKQLNELLVQLPNLPDINVPIGKTAEDNVIVHSEGDISLRQLQYLPHWDLATKYSLIDFEAGNKLTGAGFPVYTGKGARLQRALINFFLDSAVKAGYTEIEPPVLINEESAFATGQLPDKEGQMYHIGLDNLYLAPTAEVPLTNLYRNIILKVEQLPVKITAYTNCFRREAGSYGKDVRGLNRIHQFDKVEIVQVQAPEFSYQTLEDMRTYVATICRQLELPFRIVKLCGGDLSFTSALTYDFEVFAKGQQRWLEVSSVSNFETFQSNRLKLRFKDKEGKTRLLHTLNGSALALPRIVAALLENNQIEDKIIIPPVLIPYTGFEFIS
ncbi:MAG: serine--tRNA ligase [Bacteroidales bacterium]|nr:serine--tRNA ligase [Bacteroidales bacterium]